MIKQTKAFHLAILALFIAIVILQSFVPFLGYIPVGPINITIVQITVIIAAVLLGPKDGALLGLVWGLLSWVRAFVAPTSPLSTLVFTNPLVSVVPRVLVGLFAGYVFLWLTRAHWRQTWALIVTGSVGSALNTLLVVGLIGIFYRTPAVAHAYGVSSPALLGNVLMTLVGTNGIPELILSAIVVPIIATPLLKLWRR
ncbi:ECF transporter S component [Fructilactobacillus cliffordii]|uniref:ECF transporter S component n=1 Tax=Fructilactobacillus cliffordii TaxID=2940299 RepID=A0A9Q9E333_9LACO|nr:ECF transporter S component [Fructilactobacillus cliffordii]USS89168.1 ECF transporter S component [Fructilactobacillus cliffordii]